MLKYIVSLILLCLLFGPALALEPGFCRSGPRKSFDEKKWRSSSGGRLEMLDDFVYKHKIIGQSVNQVRALLGKPETSEKNVDSYHLFKKENLYCSRTPFTTLKIEYRSNRVFRYCVWQNPKFLEDYTGSPDPFPDLHTDLTWHYH
jgi:hypothetical protein